MKKLIYGLLVAATAIGLSAFDVLEAFAPGDIVFESSPNTFTDVQGQRGTDWICEPDPTEQCTYMVNDDVTHEGPYNQNEVTPIPEDAGFRYEPLP